MFKIFPFNSLITHLRPDVSVSYFDKINNVFCRFCRVLFANILMATVFCPLCLLLLLLLLPLLLLYPFWTNELQPQRDFPQSSSADSCSLRLPSDDSITVFKWAWANVLGCVSLCVSLCVCMCEYVCEIVQATPLSDCNGWLRMQFSLFSLWQTSEDKLSQSAVFIFRTLLWQTESGKELER